MRTWTGWTIAMLLLGFAGCGGSPAPEPMESGGTEHPTEEPTETPAEPEESAEAPAEEPGEETQEQPRPQRMHMMSLDRFLTLEAFEGKVVSVGPGILMNHQGEILSRGISVMIRAGDTMYNVSLPENYQTAQDVPVQAGETYTFPEALAPETEGEGD